MTIAEVIARIQRGDGCWTWSGAHVRGRPVRISSKPRRLVYISRDVYEHFTGRELGALHAHHVCENIACVNPEHIEPVTRSEHNRRRKPKTHCNHGHPFDAENTLVWRGTRLCRACRRSSKLAAKLRRLRPDHLVSE